MNSDNSFMCVKLDYKFLDHWSTRKRVWRPRCSSKVRRLLPLPQTQSIRSVLLIVDRPSPGQVHNFNQIISEFWNIFKKSGTPSEYQASKKQLEVPQSDVGGDRSIRDRSPLTEWRMTDESESSGRNTRLEMTLVFVAGSSQLIIYFHRIVNLPLRGGKQYATYVKVFHWKSKSIYLNFMSSTVRLTVIKYRIFLEPIRVFK